jgi:hypothetical protein
MQEMIDFYAIFDKSNGMCMQICTAESKISADAVCTLDQIAIQVDGEFKQDAFYLSNTSLVPILAKPSPHHTFNYTTKQWQDPRTLQDLKAAQWEVIKQARAAEITSPLVTPYGTFDADAHSRTAITDSVLLLQTMSKRGRPTTIKFTLSDNSNVDLSERQIEDVGMMLGEKTNLAFEKGRLLRVAIEDATTAEEVAGVVW